MVLSREQLDALVPARRDRQRRSGRHRTGTRTVQNEAADPAAAAPKAGTAAGSPAAHVIPPRTCLHNCKCGCELKRIGEDASEKLDYTPGVFTVERYVRGKWACAKYETLIQAPVPAQIIDKGMPTASLLSQVLMAKYADHMPLYRQESAFARASMPLARSTLAEWTGRMRRAAAGRRTQAR